MKTKTTKLWPIIIGSGVSHELQSSLDFDAYSAIVLFSDTNTQKLYGGEVAAGLKSTGKRLLTLTVQGGEEAKSLSDVEQAYKFLIDGSIDRNALLVVLGGGVVGDLGGFVAATFLRGIDYIQLPTTLLAQVDSSIGGKVGVNFDGKKNLVGSFYQPRAIICDVDFLKSLPPGEMKNGTAEVIKYGLIMDKKLFSNLVGNKEGKFSMSELEAIVGQCARLKARVVAEDETERKGRRTILNFGHTIGHAIEAVSALSGPSQHGRAVAVGMVGAAKISVELGMLSNDDFSRIEEVITCFGLPTRCPGLSADDLWTTIQFDKKRTTGGVRWVLLAGIGHALVNQLVGEDIVRKVLDGICH